MKKSGQNPENSTFVEVTKELSKDNLREIEKWLSYLEKLAGIKKASAEPMQHDLTTRYQQEWIKFFTKLDDLDDAVAVLTSEQMLQIKQAMQSWHEKEIHEKQKAGGEIFGEEICVDNIIATLEKTGLFSLAELNLIVGFFLHDSRHISTDRHFYSLLCKDQHHPESGSFYNVDKQSQRQFEFQLQNFALIANMSAYPEEWLHQLIVQRTKERLASDKLKDEPNLEEKLKDTKTTTDPVREVALPIALALQRRFFEDNYEILLNPPSEGDPQIPAIVIKTKLRKNDIPVDPAILTSLVYNLAKNAAKAIFAQKRDNPKNIQPYKIEIEINEDQRGWNFIIADTGTGLETDVLLKQAGWAVN